MPKFWKIVLFAIMEVQNAIQHNVISSDCADNDLFPNSNSSSSGQVNLPRLKKREVVDSNVDRILPVPLPPPSKTEVFDQLLQVTPFNTTMNFIVPGAKVHLAHNTEEGSLDHLAMQAFFGLFWAIAWITTVAVPTIVTLFNFQPFGIGRSFHDPDPNAFHLRWKLDERVADAIGLNWESCVRKTICQARQHRDKYGILGIAVQMLLPVPDKLDEAYHSESNAFHDMGERKEAIGQDCNHIYRCFFDVLDVLLYLKDYCFATRPTSHLPP